MKIINKIMKLFGYTIIKTKELDALKEQSKWNNYNESESVKELRKQNQKLIEMLWNQKFQIKE